MTNVQQGCAAAILLLAVGTRAEAAGTITTPPLYPPSSGSLMCDAINVSDSPVSFVAEIHSVANGAVVTTLDGTTSYPSGNQLHAMAISTSDSARFCRVTVTSGSKKNLRVTLQVRDAVGAVQAAVEAR